MNDIKQKVHHLLVKLTLTPLRTPRLATVPVSVRARPAPPSALARLDRRAQAARIVH